MRRAESDIDKYFPRVMEKGAIEPFMHKGEWAVHEVTSELLGKIGPADVRLMTFNVSEDSLRTFFFEARIRSLRMILDMNVRRHKLDMLLFAGEVTADLRIESTHAKVLLIENEHHRIGIVGSQNLNRVHRYESGFYFTDGRFYDFFRGQFDEIYENALPYDATEP